MFFLCDRNTEALQTNKAEVNAIRKSENREEDKDVIVKTIRQELFRVLAIEAFARAKSRIRDCFILNKTLDPSASLTLLGQIRNVSASGPMSQALTESRSSAQQ
jgi:hypothetical protein